jgi:hypothetical protein
MVSSIGEGSLREEEEEERDDVAEPMCARLVFQVAVRPVN